LHCVAVSLGAIVVPGVTVVLGVATVLGTVVSFSAAVVPDVAISFGAVVATVRNTAIVSSDIVVFNVVSVTDAFGIVVGAIALACQRLSARRLCRRGTDRRHHPQTQETDHKQHR
jgi:hypothetical protein